MAYRLLLNLAFDLTDQRFLVGRLLHQNEDEESQQPKRDGKADEAADVGNPLEQHDDECRADGVDGEVLPFGDGVRHRFCGYETGARDNRS